MKPIFELKNVSIDYNKTSILKGINVHFAKNKVTGIIGASGAGKSTLLRSLNRMNDLVPNFKCRGTILFDDHDIYNGVDVHQLRQKVGMVFQKPCIFPKSIRANVLFGVRHLKLQKKDCFASIVEKNLKAVSLWNEVKDRLDMPAFELSQGQQQRLTIARALAVEPQVLLMDEPTSSLDPDSAKAIEELILELKKQVTIVLVTHKHEQVHRIADHVFCVRDGEVCAV